METKDFTRDFTHKILHAGYGHGRASVIATELYYTLERVLKVKKCPH